jgi:hypothetical protein
VKPRSNAEEKPTKQRSGGAAAVAVAGLLFLTLPLLYVLALGPLVWLHDRGLMSDPVEDVVEAMYRPLAFASREIPIVKEPLEWYVGWWESTTPSAPVAPPAGRLPAPSVPTGS